MSSQDSKQDDKMDTEQSKLKETSLSEKEVEDLQLSEEDQKLKDDLELLVVRASDQDTQVALTALSSLKEEIRTSTSSLSSVPKPLKFLKESYPVLQDLHTRCKNDELKAAFADVLSVLAMTMGDREKRESLQYRLAAAMDEVATWGHEYVRHLAGEVAAEWQARQQDDSIVDSDNEDLLRLVNQLVPFQMTHNAEAEACDLLMEVQRLDLVQAHVDDANYQRVALYLLACSNYTAPPEDENIVLEVYNIYLGQQQYTNALRCALRLGNSELVTSLFDTVDDQLIIKQMGYMLARHHVDYQPDEDDDDLVEIIANEKLSESFLALGRELEILPPKEPEDIYKTHLQENNRMLSSSSGGLSSAKQNLSSTLVSAFVNAGFKSDKLMTDPKQKWLYQNKEHGMISAVASVGALYLWDHDNGVDELDQYLESDNEYIAAGALVGIGVCSVGTRDVNDTAMALLDRFTEEDTSSTLKSSAMIGLGLAYAGSKRADVYESLVLPVLSDENVSIEAASQAALAAGFIYVGSCDTDVAESILQVLFERSETQLEQSVARYVFLGLGLVFLGARDKGEVFLESLKVLQGHTRRYAMLTLDTCAFAGTGNVLKIQELLAICGEQTSEDDAHKSTYQAVAVVGLALVAMAEDLGSEMLIRSMNHVLQYGSMATRRGVPLALGLASVCNPDISIMETLSKLSHDSDEETARNAIMALGLIAAGTNNSRIAQLLRTLAGYYAREPNTLFVVRLAQGLLHMGKGTMSLQPYHSDGLLMSKVAVAGLLTFLHSCIDMEHTLLGDKHYMMYYLMTAMEPRMLTTLDENLEPVVVNVRVGEAVDVVGQAGRPKTITGFQTHSTPVLIAHGERAELATEEWEPVSNILEGFVILRKVKDSDDADE